MQPAIQLFLIAEKSDWWYNEKKEGGILSDGIVYQNKDIEFKLLSETYKEKSF